jgi:hypothetical protein
MRWAIIIAVLIGVYMIGYSFGYNQGHDQGYAEGRVDKHAEIMEFITGNKAARMALLRKDEPIQYHEAGICVTCHGG